LVLVACQGLVPPSPSTRARVLRAGGFGGTPTKITPKKTYVTAGRKDLELQWQRHFAFAEKEKEDKSVWVRIPDSVDWLLVGSVNGKDSSDSFFAEAFAAQKTLIAWCASELHLRIQAKESLAEFGLGPPVSEDFIKDYAPFATEAPHGVEPVPIIKGKKLNSKDVGFKPFKSPLKEHEATVGSSLLNKSTGKGTHKKFKKSDDIIDAGGKKDSASRQKTGV